MDSARTAEKGWATGGGIYTCGCAHTHTHTHTRYNVHFQNGKSICDLVVTDVCLCTTVSSGCFTSLGNLSGIKGIWGELMELWELIKGMENSPSFF